MTAVVKPVIWTRYKLGLGVSSQLAVLHKPIRHNFEKRRVFVFNIDDIWSADLKDMQSLAKHNKHYKYISTVIDLFSKYAYSIPLKSKSSNDIINASNLYSHLESQRSYGRIKGQNLQIMHLKTTTV